MTDDDDAALLAADAVTPCDGSITRLYCSHNCVGRSYSHTYTRIIDRSRRSVTLCLQQSKGVPKTVLT